MAKSMKKKAKTPKKVSPSWSAFLATLPVYEKISPGYLNLTDFSKRAEIATVPLRRKIMEGNIDRRFCVGFRTSRGVSIGIHWASVAYDFVSRRPIRYRQADFEKNEQRVYRPLDPEDDGPLVVAGDAPQLQITKEDGSEFGDILDAPVIDLPSAKYRSELLKIKQVEANIQLAKNETIKIEDVISANREIALNIKAALKKVIHGLAPKLAPKMTTQEARRILETGHVEALDALKKMEGTNAK